MFKAAQPFVYLPGQGDLLIELTVAGKNSTKIQYPLDAISAGRGTQSVATFGLNGRLIGNPSYRVTNPAPNGGLGGLVTRFGGRVIK